MPSYKLYYFDARGRAEAARMMFGAAGTKYEDIRISVPDWPQVKQKLHFGSLPVLEIDGKQYGQSTAIHTYIAKELGFYGKTNLDGLAIDQIVQMVSDLIGAVRDYYFVKDEGKKAEFQKQFDEVVLPKNLANFTKLLEENKTGYFVRDELTLADLEVYDVLFGIEKRQHGKLDNYPIIKAHQEKIANHPKMKSYLANRPDNTL